MKLTARDDICRLPRQARATAATISLLCAFALPAAADPLIPDTQLAGLTIGSTQSDKALKASYGTTLLADGSRQSLRPWYSTGWRDFRVLWYTETSRASGVYWGFSTGERGVKYRIDPAVHLGVVQAFKLGPRATLQVTLIFALGGRMSEKTCEADYGEIGGIQEVNCRLADSFLPPAETLDQLYNEPAADRARIEIAYTLRF